MKKIPDPVFTNTKKPPLTHYIFVIDESGSIGYLAEPLTKQLHAMARGIIEAAKKENQEVTATLVTFGTARGSQYGNGPFTHFVRQPVERLLNFTTGTYGGTPLFDSVADAVAAMATYEQSLTKDDDVSFVLIAITDGEEFSSQHYNSDSLKRIFDQKIRTDRWTFAWQLPKNYVDHFVHQFGFDRASVLGWDQNAQDVQRATADTIAATNSFMADRTKGIRSSRQYYSTNAGSLQKAEVKGNLTELPTSTVKALTVDKETDISSFIAEHNLPFVTGAGFYLLTKKEKIHAHKELILQPRGENKYFVGKADARALLGLPATGEVYVEPGNHGDWLIYVQSTSNNRKLVRGTKLLYRLDVQQGVVPQTWDWEKAHKEAVEKQLKVATDPSQPVENRVFGAIFAGKNQLKDIAQVVVGVNENEFDKVLKKLKKENLVEFTGAGKERGWKPVKGAKAPKAQTNP